MVFEWPFQILVLFGLAIFLLIVRFGGTRRRMLMLAAGGIWLILLLGLMILGLANLRKSMKFAAGPTARTAPANAANHGKIFKTP